MKTRIGWSALLIFALAGGLVALVLHRAHVRQSLEQSIAGDRARIEERHAQARAQLATAERERADLQRELSRVAKANPRPLPRPPGFPPPRPPDPAQIVRQAKQQRARLALKYAPFYRAAGIDATKADLFEQLLIEKNEQERELSEIEGALPATDRTEPVNPYGLENGTIMMDPAIAAMRRQLTAQFEADQIALLGQENYQRLKQFERDTGKRQIVERLVGDLTLTDTALTPAQTQQFNTILADIDVGERQLPDDKQWPEILQRAGTVLSPSQLATLKKQADAAEFQAARNTFGRLRESEFK